MTGINRSLISRIESQSFVPSIDQLQALTEILGFKYSDVLSEEFNRLNDEKISRIVNCYSVAVAGTGYVGLSISEYRRIH